MVYIHMLLLYNKSTIIEKAGKNNMATVEFLTKRVEGAQKKVQKLEAKLERINSAEASGWKVNPYYYDEYDKRCTLKDIEEATASLIKYREELEKAIEKDNSRDVEVIKQFLETWKAKVMKRYSEAFNDYYDMRERISKAIADSNEEEYKKMREQLNNRLHGYYVEEPYINRCGKQDHRRRKIANGEWEFICEYVISRKYDEALAKLTKDVNDEANRKYDFIIERVNNICGTMTDASDLRIGYNGELNGIIIGTKGKASVKTIGAGGYNIQQFHFRTLVHKI